MLRLRVGDRRAIREEPIGPERQSGLTIDRWRLALQGRPELFNTSLFLARLLITRGNRPGYDRAHHQPRYYRPHRHPRNRFLPVSPGAGIENWYKAPLSRQRGSGAQFSGLVGPEGAAPVAERPDNALLIPMTPRECRDDAADRLAGDEGDGGARDGPAPSGPASPASVMPHPLCCLAERRHARLRSRRARVRRRARAAVPGARPAWRCSCIGQSET